MKLKKMKLKKFITMLVFVFSMAGIVSSVYAADKRKVLDKYADEEDRRRYKREKIGNSGHYLINSWEWDIGSYEQAFDRWAADPENEDDPNLSENDDLQYDGSWIEDSEGNDLYWTKDPIYVLDDEYEIYVLSECDEQNGVEKLGALLNGKMKVFAKNVYDKQTYMLIKFDGFAVAAVTDYVQNYKIDPTNRMLNTYFDTDGNLISDLDKYLAERGVKPEDGMVKDMGSDIEKPFVKSPAVKGMHDIEPLANEKELRRIPVGKKGHYLVVSDRGDGISGSIIEDEEGNDLFSIVGYIALLDKDDEMYEVYSNSDINHSYDDARWLMNSDFKPIAYSSDGMSNYKDYYCVKFKKFNVYKAYKAVPSDEAVYYDADGEPIEDIEKYLKQRGEKLKNGTSKKYDPFSGSFVTEEEISEKEKMLNNAEDEEYEARYEYYPEQLYAALDCVLILMLLAVLKIRNIFK